MHTVVVPALWSTRGPAGFSLSPLTGAVEMVARVPDEETSTLPVALDLLDRLLVPDERGLRAMDLPLPVRDHLLAAVYRGELGGRVELRRHCPRCGAGCEAGFELAELVSAARPGDLAHPTGDGRFRCQGVEFRLPTSRDVAEATAASDLAERCAGRGLAAHEQAILEAALADLAPLVAAVVDAACPTCGASIPWPFSIGEHLVRSLHRERPLLLREIDLLARRYGWGLTEILQLERADRHQLVAWAVAGAAS